MKKITLAFFIILFVQGLLSAQITITRDDMPNVGDSLTYTETFPPSGIDYTESGANFTWDFSGLETGPQNTETYVSVSSTPLLYQAVFNWPFWDPPASIASPGEDINLIPGLPITNNFDFFKEQSSSYTSVGYGITISGIPIPVEYDNPELLYSFPLSADSQADSSESSFSLNVADLGYYETYRKRVNTVDGWGTLTTPLGTFQTIRIKSRLITYDSIYVDSLEMGLPIQSDITEYKWLANGYGRPVLSISEGGLLGANAQYLAEEVQVLTLDAGADITINQGEEAQLEAIVSGGTEPYVFVWSHGDFGNPVFVSPNTTTSYTVTLVDASFQYASDSVRVTVIPIGEQQLIQLNAGWSGISLWIEPNTTLVEDILEPVENELSVLYNYDGIYYPAENINTIETWDITSGYFIKLSSDALLEVWGEQSENRTINLEAGWNLIPILGKCEIQTEVIASQITGEIRIIKEVANTRVFWPEKAVFSLMSLKPGLAYMVNVSDSCSITFPECE